MAEDKKDSPDYEVGYGKPPQHSKFKKGQSGNPKGRPPKEKGPIKLDMEELLDGPRRVTVGGKESYFSATEIGLRKTLEKAIKQKSVREIAYLFELFEKYGAIQPGEEIFQGGVVTLPSNRMPFQMALGLFERFGFPPWNRRQLIEGSKAYRATCSEKQRKIDDEIGYPDLILGEEE